ncbi:MAG: NMN amidohydrolase-like protein YfaY [Candidatus Heimdallarchaeota archaeon LC_3]|nr:MAG: NMN amidohydrolase-like protein YfaY [Candidatus Heimdallarchaeota archaeon LC_3]
MTKVLKAEIINFGNELLIGRIVNTNANWIASKLTELGLSVTRITTLSDDFTDLKTGFMEAINRRPDTIISTGGLGPTWDDRTSEGLALALGLKLERNEVALEMIKKRYNSIGAKINPSSIKMANLPLGSTPLFNSAGTAPAIRHQKNKVTIFCIPGIPNEMKVVFDEHILPELKSREDKTSFFQEEFTIEGIGESRLAHVTEELTEKYSQIYIKSHPTHEMTSEGLKSVITFHLTAYGNENIKETLQKVKESLQSKLLDLGANIVK